MAAQGFLVCRPTRSWFKENAETQKIASTAPQFRIAATVPPRVDVDADDDGCTGGTVGDVYVALGLDARLTFTPLPM